MNINAEVVIPEKEGRRTVRLQVTIPEDLAVKLEQLYRIKGKTKSQLVEEGLALLLNINYTRYD